jgi:hypothetical protein
MHQQIMELLQINTLAMWYNNIHFVIYNINKEHVIQLISIVEWKVVYQGYLNVFWSHVCQGDPKGTFVWKFEGVENKQFK